MLREPEPVLVGASQSAQLAESAAARERRGPQGAVRATLLRLLPGRHGPPLRLPHDLHAPHQPQRRPAGQYKQSAKAFINKGLI